MSVAEQRYGQYWKSTCRVLRKQGCPFAARTQHPQPGPFVHRGELVELAPAACRAQTTDQNSAHSSTGTYSTKPPTTSNQTPHATAERLSEKIPPDRLRNVLPTPQGQVIDDANVFFREAARVGETRWRVSFRRSEGTVIASRLRLNRSRQWLRNTSVLSAQVGRSSVL